MNLETPEAGLANLSRRHFAQGIIVSAAAGSRLGKAMKVANEGMAQRTPSITDVEGILVGHRTLKERPTGCTVITAREAFVAGVDVRGGAPGTRETDLLRPENTVSEIDAIFISGGSAFGLDAAAGVVKFLEERGRGFEVRGTRVPIVCGAILYDLMLGDARIRPDARAGYQAAEAASGDPVAEGNVGAGAGCTVGKMLGLERAMKSGLGSWSTRRPDGLIVGALVAVNAVGDIVDPAGGRIVAGARGDRKGRFLNTVDQIRRGGEAKPFTSDNTVIGIVATNAMLNKSQCTKVAQMAQDALARCIYPSHTPYDGDAVFSLATGRWSGGGKPADVGIIGTLAADTLAAAILRAVDKAEPWGNFPSARSWK